MVWIQILLVTFLMFTNIAVTETTSFNINGKKVHKACTIKNYCKNGGTCYSYGRSAEFWSCNCVDDWSGGRCDVKQSCLNPSLCFNGGTCIGVVTQSRQSYYCQCADGWSTRRCRFKDICLKRDFCRNGGTCTDAGRSGRLWKCVCSDGWYGKRCDSKTPVQKNSIINSLCNNGGTPSVNDTCKCPESWSGPRCNEFIGTARMEYIALLLDHHGFMNNPPYLLLTTNRSTTVYITRTGKRIEQLTFESSLPVKRPISFGPWKVVYEAVRIRSTNPISVTMLEEDFFSSSDTTTIFPTEKLSTTYLISSADPTLFSTSVDTTKWEIGSFNSHVSDFVLSQVVIVALYDNTSVCITLPPHLRQDPYDYIGKIRGQTTLDNTTFEIKLNPLEPFQIYHFLDFSGTKIYSSKPVAVFSGLMCSTSFDCNHIIQQMPPVDHFDVTFIVPPNHRTSTTIIRVISEENTTIRVSSATKSGNVSISAGVPHDIESFDEVVLIQSTLQCGGHQCKRSSPLLVNILVLGKELFAHCMYMTLVPGVHHYQRYYKIVVPNQSYITVIIRENAASSLLLNGNRINSQICWYLKYSHISVEGVKYRVIVIEVSKGEVTLESKDAAFGLIAYGYGVRKTYAFAGNVLFH